MTDLEHDGAARKLETACELFSAGLDLKRQNLRRQHPDLDDEAIGELLEAWLRHRPGAEHGDADGRPGVWPRKVRTS